MACGCKKCNCARISSNAVKNMGTNCGCVDVCANPICGDPSLLSIMAPLIYDEIGINLCATFPLGNLDLAAAYPTAVTASVRVIDIAYTYGSGTGDVEIDAIAGRPNCYAVTLSNLTVTFAVSLYDSACRYLGTISSTAVYLPSDTSSATYNADTNPSSVQLEIFAPYGISYIPSNTGDVIPALNILGFSIDNNSIRQGLNLYAIPKILDFETTDSTITVGLTLILQSLYFSGFQVASSGRLQPPKGSILTPDNSDCMQFVAGDLLDLQIKPLQLNPPYCEGSLKQNCANENACGSSNGGCNSCNSSNSGCNSCNSCGQQSCSYFATDNTVSISPPPPAPPA